MENVPLCSLRFMTNQFRTLHIIVYPLRLFILHVLPFLRVLFFARVLFPCLGSVQLLQRR
jgi:hypothetical protein